MKVLILHLSDIHFAGVDDYVTDYIQSIARSVRELECHVDLGVVVVSGDVAQSGRPVEYAQAMSFFNTLGAALKAELTLPEITWVISPGNHDCFHDPAQDVVRGTLLDAIRKAPERANDPAMVETCTAPQASFFKFLRELAPPTVTISPLCYEYRKIEDDTTLVFRCLNTAWMSLREETPATLYFPAEIVPEPEEAAVVVITVYHHPSNWLEPNNRRAFLQTIDKSSDLVLTGHEHDPANYVKIDSSGVRSEYVEGSVLQDRSREIRSGFNIVLLDLGSASTKAVAHFALVGDNYVRTSGDLEHHPFTRKRLCGRKPFSIAETWRSWLDDPELKLAHAAKGRLNLSDIFVWPNFRELSYTKPARPLLSGTCLLERIAVEKCVLISGPARCGKTAVCKKLYETFRAEGRVPVYVSCSDLSVRPETIVGVIEAAFVKQYSRDDLSAYRQLSPNQRSVILDAVHTLRMTPGAKMRLLEKIAEYSEYVILTSDDMAQHIEDIVYSKESLASPFEFKPYRLNELGHVQRCALAERWLAIGVDAVDATARIAQEWPEIQRIIDTIVGNNFVPSYPVFVIAILQARESSRPIDTKASTYGYFYETFIRTALSAGSHRFDPLTKREYLSRLARWMYDKRVAKIAEADLREFHSAYEQIMQTKLAFTLFHNELADSEILVIEGECSAFRHDYMYYYFVAHHLSDHMDERATRSAIKHMAAHLHVEEFANVMLFLAHLSRAPYILETMLGHAASLYREVTPANLGDDVSFIGEDSIEMPLAYTDDDVVVSRRRWLEQLDEYDNQPARDIDAYDSAATKPVDDGFEAVLQMNAAFKTLEILGQVLKNFAGAMEGDTKLRIATECYMLGLRVLGMALVFIRENKESVYAEMYRVLRREHPAARDAALLRRAEGAVFYFGQIISYGVIKRVSNALGSDRLSLTYASVRQRFQTPAVELVDMSLKLDHFGEVPESEIFAFHKTHAKRPLAESLLRQLVVRHFELFEVHVTTKQRVCARLKIPYQKAIGTDRREVLIATPAFRVPKLLNARSIKP